MLTILNDAGFDGPGVLRAVVTADMPHHEVQSKSSEAPEAAPLAGDKFRGGEGLKSVLVITVAVHSIFSRETRLGHGGAGLTAAAEND